MYCLLFVYKTLNVSVTDKDRNYQVAALAWVSALALSAVALAAGSMFELEPAPLLVLHPVPHRHLSLILFDWLLRRGIPVRIPRQCKSYINKD